jgi:hypothetical protein
MNVKTDSAEARFFSVSYSCSIGGSNYRPGVCYKLSSGIREAVEGMVKKGTARRYQEEVRFVSGRAIPVNKQAHMPPPTPPPLAPAKTSKRSARSSR